MGRLDVASLSLEKLENIAVTSGDVSCHVGPSFFIRYVTATALWSCLWMRMRFWSCWLSSGHPAGSLTSWVILVTCCLSSAFFEWELHNVQISVGLQRHESLKLNSKPWETTSFPATPPVSDINCYYLVLILIIQYQIHPCFICEVWTPRQGWGTEIGSVRQGSAEHCHVDVLC